MINLLPPLEKEELFREQRYKLFLILGILVMVFLVALSLALFAVKSYILGEVRDEKIVVPSNIQDLEEEILEINGNLQRLNSFYTKQSDFAELLDKISQVLPQNVYLTSISLNSDTKKSVLAVSLQGFSSTRELLFQLKKNLESEQGFKNIDFPPSSWVRPENIEFSASFKVEL